jgi:hypothetical protein
MFARVATFEGEPDQIREMAANIGREADESGPPEGLPAKEFFFLTGRDSGKGLAIVLFETEDDLRQGDETLNAMSPDEPSIRRTGVELFDIPIHFEA